MALTWTSTLVLPSHPAQWARQGLLIDSDTGLHFRAQSSMGPWESGSPRRPASARWGASGPDRVFQVPLQRALAESEPGPGLLAPVPDSDTSLGSPGSCQPFWHLGQNRTKVLGPPSSRGAGGGRRCRLDGRLPGSSERALLQRTAHALHAWAARILQASCAGDGETGAASRSVQPPPPHLIPPLRGWEVFIQLGPTPFPAPTPRPLAQSPFFRVLRSALIPHLI